MEKSILSHLVFTEKYGRKVLPFLKEEYFQEQGDQTLFNLINEYVQKYNNFPTKEALFVELSGKDNLDEGTYTEIQNSINDLSVDATTQVEWLVDKTEKFCQDKAIYNAIRSSIQIIDGKSKLSKNSIPELLKDALGVSFTSHIGHDFIEDWNDRYDSYHKIERRLRFDIDILNKVTGGGVPPKTLNCILAPTGVGKSLALCHMAAVNLMDQKNVLYITLEMAEERIAQRIDANLLNVPIGDLPNLSKAEYNKKLDKLRVTTKGKLIVKEYPTATAGPAHFRHLLNELKIKKNFVPDVIYIDYLNLCISSRIKAGAQVNSYTYVKAIAEELRGLAVEYDLPIWTATQTNRSALNNSDIGLEHTSDSMGLPMTLDFYIALNSPPELQEMGQLLVSQLKSRYGDPSYYKNFVIGVDRTKMRLYNVENSAQDIDEKPVMDSTTFGHEDRERNKKFDKGKFSGFK
jgi:replicative DNA helicase